MNDPRWNRYHPKLCRFSFEDFSHWDDAPIYGDDFAERRVADCLERAAIAEGRGEGDLAERERLDARVWGAVKGLPVKEDHPFEEGAWSQASEQIDILLERAKVSPDAMIHLVGLSRQLHKGLCALAASGAGDSAAALLTSLSFATEDLQKLARKDPAIFREHAQRLEAIPGMVSPGKEQTKVNEQLVKLLGVGETFPIWQPDKKTRGKPLSVVNTAPNFWAKRLFEYIQLAQMVLPTLVDGRSIELPPGSWERRTLLLGEFTKASWPQWFEVAWEIVLEVTDGKPEEEPRLRKIGASAVNKKYRLCNPVSRSWPSDVEAKIKERLKKAFKTLAWR